MAINKGFIKIEVSVIAPEKFLNAVWNKKVKVSNVKKIDITTIQFLVDYEDYEEINEVVKRFHGKLRVVSEKGLLLLLKR